MADASITVLDRIQQAIADQTATFDYLYRGETSGVVSPPPHIITRSLFIQRPSDTNAYAANDALSNSTSAPVPGGFSSSNRFPVLCTMATAAHSSMDCVANHGYWERTVSNTRLD